MQKLKTRKKEETEEQLPENWFERASDVARRFELPVPEEVPEMVIKDVTVFLKEHA